MNLIPEEKIILESDNKELILTSLRIIYRQDLGRGEKRFTSIMLEELNAAQFVYSRRIMWILFALLSIVFGIAGAANASPPAYPIILGIVFAIIFIIIYKRARKAVIALCAGQVMIQIPAKRMSFEQIENFIAEIDNAKNKRYLLLQKITE